MKRSAFLHAGLVITALAFGIGALSSAEPAANDTLSRKTQQAVAQFDGLARVDLPVDKERRKIERRYSTSPGRMVIPRGITVDKKHTRLHLTNMLGDTLATFPVCASANMGQKKWEGDSRTPEGIFNIYGIYNSTSWTYKDTGEYAYGPWFIYVITRPFTDIGIHGTNAPWSVPGRRSHGCMRLHNENICLLKPMVTKDVLVTIMPDDGVFTPLKRLSTPVAPKPVASTATTTATTTTETPAEPIPTETAPERPVTDNLNP